MKIPQIPNKPDFSRMRKRHNLRIADFRSLFRTKQSDSWPLQSRIKEFDFLPGNIRQKDKAILAYSIWSWMELQAAGILEDTTKPYVSFLLFDAQIKRYNGILWPYLFFANNNLNHLKQSEWTSARGKFVDYLRSLLIECKIADCAHIIKYQWKGGESAMRGIVAIEFDNPICQARKPIHTFFKKRKLNFAATPPDSKGQSAH